MTMKSEHPRGIGGRYSSPYLRRDGRLVTFDVTRIESAVARAAREVGHAEPQVPASVAAAVADAIALRV